MSGLSFAEIADMQDKPESLDAPLLKELHAILEAKSIRTVFQPIVSLTEATIIGYEALSRGPEGSPLERPDALFQLAYQHNMIWELEYLCRGKALEKARDMGPDKMAFINIDPKSIDDPRFQKGMTREMLEKYGLNAANVIFE